MTGAFLWPKNAFLGSGSGLGVFLVNIYFNGFRGFFEGFLVPKRPKYPQIRDFGAQNPLPGGSDRPKIGSLGSGSGPGVFLVDI